MANHADRVRIALHGAILIAAIAAGVSGCGSPGRVAPAVELAPNQNPTPPK